MTIEITIEVPNGLGEQLQHYRDRLPELLERGLHELIAEELAIGDENAIVELLASQPSPKQIIALRPSPELQSRASELLDKEKNQMLTRQEERELERYLMLEHLLRLAKAHAYRRLRTAV
jgi:hypothetical protein